MERLIVWVENQPEGIGTDGTPDYLETAGFPGRPEVSATEDGWRQFREMREAVAQVGHGDLELNLEDELGAPSLVASLASADGAGRDLQEAVSRTAMSYADFVREAVSV